MWKKWSSFWKRAFWWRGFITVMFSLCWVSCFLKRDFPWWSYLTWNTETCVTSFAVRRGSVARTQTHQICYVFCLSPLPCTTGLYLWMDFTTWPPALLITFIEVPGSDVAKKWHKHSVCVLYFESAIVLLSYPRIPQLRIWLASGSKLLKEWSIWHKRNLYTVI